MAAIFTGREWLVTYELAIPGYPFTLATWFRASLAQPHAALLAWGNFTNLPEYHAITLSADGLHLQADSRKGTDVGEATSGTAFSQGVWTHAAAIFVSATERHIWQNGVRMDGSTRAIPFMGLRCVLGASAQSSGADFVDRFQGELSHAAVYSAALTADEIAALAKRFSPPIVRPHSLLAYWPLGTGSTSGVLWFDRWRDRRNLTGGGIGVAPLVSGEGPFMRARRGRARVALATAAVTAPTLTLIAPVGGVLVWPVRLQWGAFGADRYDVYLGTTPSPPLVSANQIANVFDASTHVSANGSTYYWKIVAKNAIGETTSRVETFNAAAAWRAEWTPAARRLDEHSDWLAGDVAAGAARDGLRRLLRPRRRAARDRQYQSAWRDLCAAAHGQPDGVSMASRRAQCRRDSVGSCLDIHDDEGASVSDELLA
jgi:hypothetical protein